MASAAAAVLLAACVVSCGKQEEGKVDKTAAEDKAKAVTDAKAAEASAREVEAREIATEAYVYAYPLVTMEVTRRVVTNVDKPGGSKAPMGQFARLRA
jgi:hypothetical protein